MSKALRYKQSFGGDRVKFREFAPRPLTPTTGDLKALDEEVEQKLEKNVLKLDDWSEEDPYAGVGAVKRFFKKYFMLPQGRSYK